MIFDDFSLRVFCFDFADADTALHCETVGCLYLPLIEENLFVCFIAFNVLFVVRRKIVGRQCVLEGSLIKLSRLDSRYSNTDLTLRIQISDKKLKLLFLDLTFAHNNQLTCFSVCIKFVLHVMLSQDFCLFPCLVVCSDLDAFDCQIVFHWELEKSFAQCRLACVNVLKFNINLGKRRADLAFNMDFVEWKNLLGVFVEHPLDCFVKPL